MGHFVRKTLSDRKSLEPNAHTRQSVCVKLHVSMDTTHAHASNALRWCMPVVRLMMQCDTTKIHVLYSPLQHMCPMRPSLKPSSNAMSDCDVCGPNGVVLCTILHATGVLIPRDTTIYHTDDASSNHILQASSGTHTINTCSRHQSTHRIDTGNHFLLTVCRC